MNNGIKPAARVAVHAEPVRKARFTVAAAVGALVATYAYSVFKELRKPAAA